MRRITVLAFALGLAPGVAYAQGQQPPPPTPPTQTPQPTQTAPAADVGVGTGIIDFSVRGTSVDGDAARYERYRDLGDGLALEVVRLHRERNNYLFDFGANHVARNDQRYRGDIVNPGKLKAWALWDQIPMLMSRTTQTLFADTNTAVFLIDDALQQQVLDLARSAKGGAGKAVRQTEAAVKLYPVTTVLLVAAAAGALVLAGRSASAPRHRSYSPRDELRDLYHALRERV